jgi:hypothetical protein
MVYTSFRRRLIMDQSDYDNCYTNQSNFEKIRAWNFALSRMKNALSYEAT